MNAHVSQLASLPLGRKVVIQPKAVPAIDQMDAALDLLTTAETALFADGHIDEDTIRAVRGSIGQALKMLAPVRELVNDI